MRVIAADTHECMQVHVSIAACIFVAAWYCIIIMYNMYISQWSIVSGKKFDFGITNVVMLPLN